MKYMTEVRQGPTPRVRFRELGVRFNEVSVKRELTVQYINTQYCIRGIRVFFRVLKNSGYFLGDVSSRWLFLWI